MKTVFVTSFNPFVSRNILATDVLRLVKADTDLRVIIFCPDYKLNYFQKQFGDTNVSVEGVPTETVRKQDIIFSYLGSSLIRTKTLLIHRKEIFLRNRRILTFLFSHLLFNIGWFPGLKALVRWLDYCTIDKNYFVQFFNQYRPELIFATDVYNVDDVHMLAEAKRRRIRTVGMIRSWDNITNKGLFRVKPDKLIVHNEVLRDEACRYGAISHRDILVSGLPQFDIYTQPLKRSRMEFFQKVKLDPKKKTILVAPHGSRFYKEDWTLLEALKKTPYQYIVRLPPNDCVDLSRFTPNANFFIEHPGHSFRPGIYRDQELTREDTEGLAEELSYCDLVINYGSTVSIDAAFFNRPIIIVAFDGTKGRPYLQSVRRFLDFTHIRKTLGLQYCKIAFSEQELLSAMDAYLRNPNLDQAGRQRLVSAQVWKTDGRSGQRIAQFVLEQL